MIEDNQPDWVPISEYLTMLWEYAREQAKRDISEEEMANIAEAYFEQLMLNHLSHGVSFSQTIRYIGNMN